MSAICGLVPLATSADPGTLCGLMLEAQARYGPHARDLLVVPQAALGRALYRLLPEDEFDAQPVIGGGGRFVLVADLRIDNRGDLLRSLNRQDGGARALSDSAILMMAFERWQERAFDRVAGAFAAAVWDSESRSLVLARDATGQRPLHYHENSRYFAFSSLPSGLHALPDLPKAADEERVVEFVGGIGSEPDRTFYKGVRSLSAGHLLFMCSTGAIARRRYWDPSTDLLRLRRPEDYVEAYRAKLDEVVGTQLRGAGQLVASHLSSGFDSSAVAATAARLLAPKGGRVLALTAAPRENYMGAVPRGRIADESGIAAQTVALHPNMDHQIVRPGRRILTALHREELMVEEPFNLICNNVWWQDVNSAAQAAGARVLLVGEAGNMTISAGSLHQLAEMVSRGQWLAWWSETRALVSGGTIRWRGALAASFAPWLPRRAWQLLNTAFLGTSKRTSPSLFIGEYWRERLASREAAPTRDSRPPKNMRHFRKEALQGLSPGTARKQALALWGIDERDPTADRRMAEFSLSLPPEMLLHGGMTRALARRALADRLPAAVLSNPLRGLQFADWHEQVNAGEAAGALHGVRDDEAVKRVLDVEQLTELIKSWPDQGWGSLSVIRDYRLGLLRALAAAYFLHYASRRSV